MEKYVNDLMPMVLAYLPKLALALVTLVVGWFVINSIIKYLFKIMETKQVEPGLATFIKSVASMGLKTLLIITVAGMVGIETTSFIAVLGAATLAIGMALQGSLANFAGGVLILLFRPFKVGDYIAAQGYSGTVSSIQVFCTVLKTPDNRTIILPNGPLAGGAIENVSAEELRRVDMTFGISYDDDIDEAKQAIQEALAKNPYILDEPETAILVSELADSSVNFVVRPWCKKEHYWDIYHSTHEHVKKVMDEKNISIPFPQQDTNINIIGGGATKAIRQVWSQIESSKQ